MTTLPSFIELMATLGLDNRAQVPEHDSRSPSHSRSSSNTSATASPYITAAASTSRTAYRSQSIPSLRETENDRRSTGGRYRLARYQPYSSGNLKARRGSLPGIADDEFDRPPSSSSSSSSRSPRGSPFTGGRRRLPPPLEGIPSHSDEIPSSFDHKANTPISSYVRRKTPQASPISPSFPQYTFQESTDRTVASTSVAMPFTLPTLPSMGETLSSLSASASRVSSTHSSPYGSAHALPEIQEAEPTRRRPRRYTGTRLSAPHRVELSDYRSRHIAPV